MPNGPQTPDALEETIAAFERSRLAGEVALLDRFVDAAPAGRRAEYACELVRVDLEIADSRGESRSLIDYRDAVPELFARKDLLALAAFEELRLAAARGESVTARSQIDRYALRPADWPTPVGREESAPSGYPRVGEAFDGMPLERVLGAGAFSRVYAARQPRFGDRIVALKVTAAGSIEPQRLGRLQHTNIVPVYSAHLDRGMLGIAMPLLGERTLADRLSDSQAAAPDRSTLRASGDPTLVEIEPQTAAIANAGGRVASRLDWRAAAALVAELAAGIAHAHARGVTHGDIKPANVLVGDDDIPRLLDFNLASVSDGPPADTLVVGGTLPYLAPEHLEAITLGRAITPACDLYSLGVILFEAIAGRRPFPDRGGDFDRAVDAMRRDRQAPPPLPADCGAPAGVAAIVRKCLSADPSRRYADARLFESELRRELDDLPLRCTREPSPRARWEKWLRRNRGSVARSLAAVGAAAAVVAFAIGQARLEHARTLAAQGALATFQDDLLAARMSLGAAQPDADLRRAGRDAIDRAVAAVASPDTRARLTPSGREVVLAGVGELAVLAELCGGVSSVSGLADELGVTAARPAEDAFLSALTSLRRGRFGESVEPLRGATAERPGDPALWLQLGVAEAAAGDPAAADAAFTAAVALQPAAGVVRRTRASALLDAGRYRAALDELDALPAADREIPVVQMNRALAYLGLGDHAEAERAATQAIDGGLDQPRALLVRSRCREALGDLDGAVADRVAALDADPIDDADWAARAVAFEKTDPNGALAEIDRGLASHPRSVLLLRNRLHLLGDLLGRREEALLVADKLAELIPEDLPAALGRGVCLASLGQGARAVPLADALQARVVRPIDRLQLACVYALAADQDPTHTRAAIDHAVRAFAEDPRLALRASRDPDLAALRNDPRYAGAIAAAAALASTAADSHQQEPAK